MNARHLLAVGAAAAMLLSAASPAEAQQRTGGGFRTPVPTHKRFVFPFVFVERVPVVIEREVIREVPVVVSGTPNDANSGTPNRDVPELAREPYVLGKSYASLPGGCMKLIEEGASYYLCSGEWYRQVGSGSAAKFKAVARP